MSVSSESAPPTVPKLKFEINVEETPTVVIDAHAKPLPAPKGDRRKSAFEVRTKDQAATAVQSAFRSHNMRRVANSLTIKINIKYELELSRTRIKRRGLFTKSTCTGFQCAPTHAMHAR